MDKKVYMTPELEIFEMKVQQMLTASLTVGSEGSANEAESPELIYLDF